MLLIENAVPMPFKECWIDVILSWRDKHGVLDRREVEASVVVFREVVIKEKRLGAVVLIDFVFVTGSREDVLCGKQIFMCLWKKRESKYHLMSTFRQLQSNCF